MIAPNQKQSKYLSTVNRCGIFTQRHTLERWKWMKYSYHSWTKPTNTTLNVRSQTHKRMSTTLSYLCKDHKTSKIKLCLRIACLGGKTIKKSSDVVVIKVRLVVTLEGVTEWLGGRMKSGPLSHWQCSVSWPGWWGHRCLLYDNSLSYSLMIYIVLRISGIFHSYKKSFQTDDENFALWLHWPPNPSSCQGVLPTSASSSLSCLVPSSPRHVHHVLIILFSSVTLFFLHFCA